MAALPINGEVSVRMACKSEFSYLARVRSGYGRDGFRFVIAKAVAQIVCSECRRSRQKHLNHFLPGCAHPSSDETQPGLEGFAWKWWHPKGKGPSIRSR